MACALLTGLYYLSQQKQSTCIHNSSPSQDVLMKCWSYKPSDRPDFISLMKSLEKLPKKRSILARSPSHPLNLSRSAESVFWRIRDLVRNLKRNRLIVTILIDGRLIEIKRVLTHRMGYAFTHLFSIDLWFSYRYLITHSACQTQCPESILQILGNFRYYS